MTSESSKMWLDTYLADLNAMSDVQRAEERREHYAEASQINEDYLDYVEEWQWHTTQQENDLLTSTIRCLANRNLSVECDCKRTHHLALHKQAKDESFTIVDSLDIFPHQQCWYRTLKRIVSEVIQAMDQEKQTFGLPKTLVNTLTMVSKWRLVQMSQTPILLGIEGYRTLWWTLTDDQKPRIAREILERITFVDRQRVESEHRSARTRIPESKHRILLHFPHSDHGFHLLMKSLPVDQARSVFRFINKLRTNIDPKARILWRDLEQKMNDCSLCERLELRDIPKPTDFPMAVYYAPPGIGKTTALNQGKLIALDTDWIGIGPTWVDYSQIFQKSIPIITNQHTAFIGCSVKVIGVYNSAIREMDGRPLTTAEAIEEIYHQWPTEMFLIRIPRKKHFSDYITHLHVYSTYQTLLEGMCMQKAMLTEDEEISWRRLYPRALKRAFV